MKFKTDLSEATPNITSALRLVIDISTMQVLE